MQEVIPDDNTELKNVWLRKKEDDESFLPEDFLGNFLKFKQSNKSIFRCFYLFFLNLFKL